MAYMQDENYRDVITVFAQPDGNTVTDQSQALDELQVSRIRIARRRFPLTRRIDSCLIPHPRKTRRPVYVKIYRSPSSYGERYMEKLDGGARMAKTNSRLQSRYIKSMLYMALRQQLSTITGIIGFHEYIYIYTRATLAEGLHYISLLYRSNNNRKAIFFTWVACVSQS